MSDSRYSYDEGTDVWPFYAATILGSIVIPVTISRLASSSSTTSEQRKVTQKAYNASAQQKYLTQKQRSSLLSFSSVALITGWILLGAIIYIIVTGSQSNGPQAPTFNPWELLGVSMTSSAKEIKSAYRKLSLQFHPDKVKLVGNMTLEDVESKFVELTKAYKALTDEVTIENFRLYGHPDGPQQTSHGIALPAFLVGSASPAVLAVYAILGVYGPYKLSQWWYNQTSQTRGNIRTTTAERFFEYFVREQPLFAPQETLLEEILVRGEAEYRAAFPKMTLEQRRELIQAHLERQSVAPVLEVQKLKVVEITLQLLQGFVGIAEEFKFYPPVHRAIQLQRSLVQAVPIRYQRMGGALQLPDVELGPIKAGRMPAITNETIVEGQKYLPNLKLLRAKAFLPGLPTVIPGSKPFLEFKFLVYPMGTRIPEIAPEELEDVLQVTPQGKDLADLADPLLKNKKAPKVPNVRSQYYPGDFLPGWHGYVVNERDPKFVSNPISFSHIDLSNLKLTRKELQNGENITIGTWTTSFYSQMPLQVGLLRFRLKVLNTGYFGCDIDERISVELKQPPPLAEPEEEEEDLDDSDKEEEEDLSDIDTDTEDEAEAEPETKPDAKAEPKK